MRLSRRRALLGAGALAWTTTLSLAPRALAHAGEPDVVVVGAGAAGLAATRVLLRHGRSVRLIEAKARIGGRAFTESTSLGVPFDHGCMVLHRADHNPFATLAKSWGLPLQRFDEGQDIVYDGRAVTRTGYVERALNRVVTVLDEAGARAVDVPVSTLMPKPQSKEAEAWDATAGFLIGPADAGVDLDALSSRDLATMAASEPNLIAPLGYGALIARFGASLPVAFRTRASAIHWDGAGVRVETTAGTLRARAVIVTVSTGALAAGAIRFTPALPVASAQAIEDLPMGMLFKVALALDETDRSSVLEDIAANTWLIPRVAQSEAFLFLCRPAGLPYVVAFAGGRFGWALARAPSEEAVAAARSALGDLWGSAVGQTFKRGLATGWGTDPDVRGAYAAARPGRWSARAALATPVGERIFFAGEACAMEDAQTAHGAYLSGEAAARAVIAALATSAE